MSVTNGSFSTYYSTYGGLSDRITLNWERTATSGNTSTIKVELILNGESTGRTVNSASYTFTMNTGTLAYKSGGGTLSGGTYNTGINNDWFYSGSGTVINTSYFTITHSNGEAEFSIALTGVVGNATITGSGGPYVLPTLISQCGAPTSVSASGFVAPSGTITVSWSGATAGTNNSINGYTVYYKVSSNGAVPTTSSYTGTKNVSSTSTSGSTTISLSNATRGYKVVFGIVTKGQAGSSYYSTIKTGGSVSVNRLPGAPSLSSSEATNVPAYTTTISVIPTKGTDQDSQTVTVRYGTNSSPTVSNTTQCTSGSTLNLSFTNLQQTWYFWSYDGYEFSSTSVTFRASRKTSCTVGFSDSPTATYYTAKNQVNQYVKSIKLPMEWTNLQSGENNVSTYRIYYTTDGSNPNTNSSFYDQINSTSITGSGSEITTRTLTLNTATWLAGANISTNNDIKFIFAMTINNGYSTDTYVDSTIYQVAGAPIIAAYYNQFDSEDISGTTHGRFYNKVRIIYSKDTLLTNSSFVATSGSGDNVITYQLSSIVNNSGDSTIVDLTFLDVPQSNTAVSVVITQSLNTISRSTVQVMTEARAPLIGTLNFGIQEVKPFTASGIASINTTWPFGNSEYETFIADYELGNSSNIQIEITCNGQSVQKNVAWTKNGDLLTGSINVSDLYSFNNNDFSLQYSGIYSFSPRLKITNLYGGIYYSDISSGNHFFNFNEEPNFNSLNILYLDQIIANNTKMQEGLTLTFNPNISIYTKGDYTITLQSSRDNGATWGEVLTSLIQNYEGATSTTAVSVSPVLSYTLPEIITNDKLIWRIVAAVNSVNGNILSNSYDVIRQTSPNITLNSCTLENNTFTYAYTQIDDGLNDNLGALNKYLSDGTIELTNPLSQTSGNISVKSGVTIPEVANITIKAVSIVTRDVSNGILLTQQKEYYTNYIIVYQITPTVAYRKNCLGINTSVPDTTAVLDIHGQTGKDSIKILGIDSNLNEINWHLILSEGTIYVTDNGATKSINLIAGTIN